MVWIKNITPKPFLELSNFSGTYVTVEIFKNGDKHETRLISGQLSSFDESNKENPTLLFISRSGASFVLHANMYDGRENKEYWFLNRMSAPPGLDDFEEGVLIYSVEQLIATATHTE